MSRSPQSAMALPITFEHAPVRQAPESAVIIRLDEREILPEQPVEPFQPEQEIAFETIRKTMARRARSK